jgi:hypothetical protein
MAKLSIHASDSFDIEVLRSTHAIIVLQVNESFYSSSAVQEFDISQFNRENAAIDKNVRHITQQEGKSHTKELSIYNILILPGVITNHEI